MTNYQEKEKTRNLEGSNLGETFKNQAESAKEKGGEFLEDAKKQAKKYASEANDAITNYAQEKPLTTILIAAAAGALFTLLVCR